MQRQVRVCESTHPLAEQTGRIGTSEQLKRRNVRLKNQQQQQVPAGGADLRIRFPLRGSRWSPQMGPAGRARWQFNLHWSGWRQPAKQLVFPDSCVAFLQAKEVIFPLVPLVLLCPTTEEPCLFDECLLYFTSQSDGVHSHRLHRRITKTHVDVWYCDRKPSLLVPSATASILRKCESPSGLHRNRNLSPHINVDRLTAVKHQLPGSIHQV